MPVSQDGSWEFSIMFWVFFFCNDGSKKSCLKQPSSYNRLVPVFLCGVSKHRLQLYLESSTFFNCSFHYNAGNIVGSSIKSLTFFKRTLGYLYPYVLSIHFTPFKVFSGTITYDNLGHTCHSYHLSLIIVYIYNVCLIRNVRIFFEFLLLGTIVL